MSYKIPPIIGFVFLKLKCELKISLILGIPLLHSFFLNKISLFEHTHNIKKKKKILDMISMTFEFSFMCVSDFSAGL